MHLPSSIDPKYFDQIYRLRPELWKAAIEEISLIHGIDSTSISPYADGSNLIARVGKDQNTIVKIFPPFHRHQWESERLY